MNDQQIWENAADLASSLEAYAFHAQEETNRAYSQREWLYRQGIASMAKDAAAKARTEANAAWNIMQSDFEI